MNILAIDYGRKRIGLAWMQEGLDVVLPFGQIQNHESRIMNQEIIALVQQENIGHIVVGLPLGLDGGENENTERVRAFVSDLKKEIDVPIEFVDERFTSAEAHRMGGDASADEKAAMLILQTYLQKK